MLTTFRASKSNIVVWILLVLLIDRADRASASRPAAAGARAWSRRRRAPDRGATPTRARSTRRLRAISTQVGRPLTMAEARQFGIDRVVLARLVGDATLDDEAARLGLSTGDGAVRGDGARDAGVPGRGRQRSTAQAYAFALERTGLTPAEFEELLRAEATRELIAASLQSAVAMPEIAGDTLLGYAGETRRFDWLTLDAGPAARAGPGARRGGDRGVLRRRIPTATSGPETTADHLRRARARGARRDHRDRPRTSFARPTTRPRDRFDAPERRIADRIGFGTTEEAAAALRAHRGGRDRLRRRSPPSAA